MTYPTIHGNGTSATMLIREHGEAYDHVRTAIEALKKCAPNGRDFYPQGPEAFDKASDEHMARLRRLTGVMTDIGEIIEHCDREKDER